MTKKRVFKLIRKHLGLKEYEPFQFANQKTNAVYYFTDSAVMKAWRGSIDKSSVSLNWLLDDGCVIKKCDKSVEVKK